MLKKNRGYLLVDISIALTIFSILSFGIFTFYKTYKRIDNDNKIKIQCLNYVNYISSQLKYNLSFDTLELDLDNEYILNVKTISSIDELKAKDTWLVRNINEANKIIDNNEELNKYYMLISIVNENNHGNINKDELNIEVKVMKDNEQYIYKNIIKRYKYIL